tara:strand:- start:345 stop:869 length:525 start_codon:yes stop_codon:yes gene_type:complete
MVSYGQTDEDDTQKSTRAGDGFGISAAYLNGKAEFGLPGGVSVESTTQTAYAFGVFVQGSLSENTKVKTDILYATATNDGATSSSIMVPFVLKFLSSNGGGFNIQAGVMSSFSLEDVDTDLVKKTAISGALGLGYDAGNFMMEVRYYPQLTNSSNIDGLTAKANSISFGLNYLF